MATHPTGATTIDQFGAFRIYVGNYVSGTSAGRVNGWVKPFYPQKYSLKYNTGCDSNDTPLLLLEVPVRK